MKESKYGFIFYIAATICFLFLLFYIVNDSPEISSPAEYVYWEEEASSKQEYSSQTSSSELPVEVIKDVDKDKNTSTSKTISSKPSTTKQPAKQQTITKKAVKHYVSSKEQSSSKETPSQSVSSDEVTSTPEEKAIIEEIEPKKEIELPKEEKSKTNNTSIININTATKQELMTLKGIGEVYSQRIIDLRNSIGSFSSIDEIMSVKGIGEKTFAAIKNRLTV